MSTAAWKQLSAGPLATVQRKAAQCHPSAGAALIPGRNKNLLCKFLPPHVLPASSPAAGHCGLWPNESLGAGSGTAKLRPSRQGFGVEVPAGDNCARGSVGRGERNISPARSRLRNAAWAEAASRGRDTAFFLLAGIQRRLDFVTHRPALNCCHGISRRFPSVEAEQPALCQSLSHANELPVPAGFGNSSRSACERAAGGSEAHFQTHGLPKTKKTRPDFHKEGTATSPSGLVEMPGRGEGCSCKGNPQTSSLGS